MRKVGVRSFVQRITQEDDICNALTFIRGELTAELLTKNRDEIRTSNIRYKVSNLYLSIYQHVHNIVYDHHLIEWFCASKEVLLQIIPKVSEDTLQKIVRTDEWRHIISWCERDRYVIDILCALYSIIEVTALTAHIGVKRCN